MVFHQKKLLRKPDNLILVDITAKKLKEKYLKAIWEKFIQKKLKNS